MFTEQEQTYCWRMNGSGCEKIPVKLGRMNDSDVEIVSGLDEGETVLLAKPREGSILDNGQDNAPVIPTAAAKGP